MFYRGNPTLAGKHLSDFMQTEYGEAESKPYLAEVRRQRQLLRNHLTRSWKPLDLLELYEDMFQAGRLSSVGRGILTGDEMNALRQTRPPRKLKRKSEDRDKPVENTVDLADLPGLAVLHDLLYGAAGGGYRHLVLDEAQDFSPLQLQVLLAACPNRSVTIVGDTAQSIYAYRGIESWDEFSTLLPPEQIKKHLIQQNYRSTAPIVAFGNAVQHALLGPAMLESRAIQRQGARPRMTALPNAEQQHLHLLSQIHELQAAGHASVAVIVSRPAEVTQISAYLQQQGLNPLALTEDQEISTDALRGVVVLPAGLSKGLEFAAVIIPNADEEHYSRSSRHDGHLLYVAISRALHELRLLTVGRFTGWLDQAQQAAEVDYTRLQRPPIRWIGQTLRTELREARGRQVPFRDISSDIALRVDALLHEKRFDEILEAYAQFGQLTTHSLNDILERLAEHDLELFVRRALDFYLPEVLRERVEVAMQELARQQHPYLVAYRQRYEGLMGLAPASPPTTPSTPQTAVQIADVSGLKKLLGKGSYHLPKQVRREYLRHQNQLLPLISGELRQLVALCIRFNLFNDATVEAARAAYIRSTGHAPEDRS